MNFVNERNEKVNYQRYESVEIKLAKEFIKADDFVLELGARYGGVSCAINSKLKNKTHQYSVEPDMRVWEALEKNKKNNNCHFNIIKGTISKNKLKIIKDSRNFPDNNDWAAFTSKGGTINDPPNYSLPEEPFNVLFADCEGFLETFYNENKNLFDNLRLIIIEKDRPDYCNYDYLEKEFFNLGFQKVYSSKDFHIVYEKKEKSIPKIFYINLDERKDRREHMEKLLQGYDFERVSAIKHEDGYIGCAKSHIICLQIARARKLDKVIILEDDFMFHKNNNFNNIKLPEKYIYGSIIDTPEQIKDKSELSKKEIKQLKKNQLLFDKTKLCSAKKIKTKKMEYDILLLCNLIKKREKINHTFSRVYQAEWTSGHLIKNTLYNDLIKNLQEGIESRLKEGKSRENNLDIYWNKLFKDYKCICHNKTFATQKEGYSDIKKEIMDRTNIY